MNALPLSERREAIRRFARARDRNGLWSVQLPIDQDLEQAVLNDDYEAAKAALEAGACADVTEIEHLHRVLFWAFFNNNLEMVELLLAYGAEVNAEDQDGNPLLSDAISSTSHNPLIVQRLLEAGADIHSIDACGHQPHMTAAGHGNMAILQMLHHAGADLNWQNGEDQDALMLAAQCGETDVVAYLLENGADTTHRDREDKSAADWAREEGYEELAVLLETHKARL